MQPEISADEPLFVSLSAIFATLVCNLLESNKANPQVPMCPMIRRPVLTLVAFVVGIVQAGGQEPELRSLATLTNSVDRAVKTPINIGSRRELFVDDFLIDHVSGARLELHHPQPANVAIKFDKPWEGAFSGYVTVVKDGDVYRLYYRGLPVAGADGSNDEVTCYAHSFDGVHWQKPSLGIHEYKGNSDNNIILKDDAPASHNFAPFLDRNPEVKAEERYKALAGTQKSGLIAYVSPDGIHWSRLRSQAVFREGIFDSQNVSFWSESENKYVCYFRTWTGKGYSGFRTISRTTSTDFVQWTAPEPMTFGETPPEHLYTNQTTPYFRAPHIYFGLAARFMPGRRVISSADASRFNVNPRYTNDCSDSVLLTSRGGNEYSRKFLSSFLRPGIGSENWVSRSNYLANGIVPTGDCESSMFISRNYGQSTAYLQRLVLRHDGFASVAAGYSGGELTTKPLVFSPPNDSEYKQKKAVWIREMHQHAAHPHVVVDQPIRGESSLQISIPTTLRLPSTQNLGERFTLAALVSQVPAGHRRLFSAYNGSSTTPNELLLDFDSGDNLEASGALRFIWNDFQMAAKIETLGKWSLESGNPDFHQIALTWDRGRARLYFDGEVVAEKVCEDDNDVVLALGDLNFGEDYPPAATDNEPFLGVLDDLLVIRRVLNDQEIAKHYQKGLEAIIAPQSDTGIALDFESTHAGNAQPDIPLEYHNTIGDSVIFQPAIELAGRQLHINMSTSAAGAIRVEIQDETGQPLPGFSLEDCTEVIGDELDRLVQWRGSSDISQFAGQPIRLRFVLKDANLYSFQIR